ncbi:MAG: pyridoxamine 5'-phosphate oxidase family protein [Gemmatimonadaceae bacterium]
MATPDKSSGSVEELRDKVKDVRMAMLSTVSNGRIVSRPMAAQEMGPDGTIWFLTSVNSSKVMEIGNNPSVGIAFSDSGSETYVSVAGIARVTNDRALIRKFWNMFYNAWFDGVDDPTIRVIEIEPVSAEYWITKGGKIVSLLSMFASAVTGKDLEAGENKTLTL